MSDARSPEKKFILNVTTLGTREHRETMDSIVKQAYTNLKKGPNQFGLLIDGPGGVPANKNSQNPLLGTYDVHFTLDGNELTAHKTPRTKNKVSAVAGLVAGAGFRDSINETMKAVETLLDAGKKPLVLNLYGFSRGAEQQLKIANELYAKYGETVLLNIFSIDPVAGLGRKKAKKSKLIPPNVRNYEVILMKDDARFEFDPQDKSRVVPQDMTKTNVTYRIYNGNHSYGIYFYGDPHHQDKETQLLDTTHMISNDIHAFAERNGTTFSQGCIPPVKIAQEGKTRKYTKLDNMTPTQHLSNEEKLNFYMQMINKEKAYQKTSSPTLGPKKTRNFVSRKTNYFLHGTDFFQDREHMRIFNELYPNFFDHFFQKKAANKPDQLVWDDILKMLSNRLLVDFLKDKAQINIYELINKRELPLPSGIPIIANHFYPQARKPGEAQKPQNGLMLLWEGVQTITQAVITDYDKSISKNKAKQLLQDVYQIMVADKSEDSKKMLIQSKIITHITENENKDRLYLYKLSALIDNGGAKLTQHIIRSIEDYAQKTSSQNEKDLLKQVANCLATIEGTNNGNDVTSIQKVLDIALRKARDLRGGKLNGPLEKKLRKCLITVSGYTSQTLPHPKVKESIATFEKITMASILSDGRKGNAFPNQDHKQFGFFAREKQAPRPSSEFPPASKTKTLQKS